MGELIDKAKGAINDAIGKGKEEHGRKTGDDRLVAEGKVQQAKGEGQKLKGSVKGALGDNI
ncbi:MAG TPA: CsbD family protein [Croceibacterium sp.]|nr:CsbD family protein [Croceibacterium sp.]